MNYFLQFVNFTEIMSKHMPQPKKEAEFALAALMEIPSQYKAIMGLQILGYVPTFVYMYVFALNGKMKLLLTCEIICVKKQSSNWEMPK